jgi:hypothetical protein
VKQTTLYRYGMTNPNPDRANLRPFPKGVSGHPGGKPKGARNRLQAKFLKALAADFQAHGQAAIEAVRVDDPAQYLRIVASLVEREPETVGVTGNLSLQVPDHSVILERVRKLLQEPDDVSPPAALNGGDSKVAG